MSAMSQVKAFDFFSMEGLLSHLVPVRTTHPHFARPRLNPNTASGPRKLCLIHYTCPTQSRNTEYGNVTPACGGRLWVVEGDIKVGSQLRSRESDGTAISVVGVRLLKVVEANEADGNEVTEPEDRSADDCRSHVWGVQGESAAAPRPASTRALRPVRGPAVVSPFEVSDSCVSGEASRRISLTRA
ncbi:unnamed protein product [Gadus morhua 'NCC']